MTKRGRETVWVSGDQLTRRPSAFDGRTPSETTVLFVETLSRAKARPYHEQKLVLLWSAMRHFAEELQRLDRFGPYEDAMVAGEAAIDDSAFDLCRRAEARYPRGRPV